jgi:hypothetical protein
MIFSERIFLSSVNLMINKHTFHRSRTLSGPHEMSQSGRKGERLRSHKNALSIGFLAACLFQIERTSG